MEKEMDKILEIGSMVKNRMEEITGHSLNCVLTRNILENNGIVLKYLIDSELEYLQFKRYNFFFKFYFSIQICNLEKSGIKNSTFMILPSLPMDSCFKSDEALGVSLVFSISREQRISIGRVQHNGLSMIKEKKPKIYSNFLKDNSIYEIFKYEEAEESIVQIIDQVIIDIEANIGMEIIENA
jgi:hypothetical protein